MSQFELNVKVNGVEQSVKTIGQLEKALEDTNKQLASVEESSREFKFLQNQAQNLEKVLGALSDDAGKLDKSLKGVNSTSKTLNQTFTSTAQAANSIDDKKIKSVGKEIKESSNSSQSLRKELRDIVLELQKLEPGSKRFQELTERAGELKNQIGDTNAVINALSGNTTQRLGLALANTAQIGIAGFQAVTAAQALFGSESEEIQKSLVKLTALLNLSQAVETFGGLGNKITEVTTGFKSLFPAAASAATATTAAATATAAEGTAAAGAAVSTTAFGVALNALPLVAIATALGVLVAGLISYASGSDKVAKAEEERKKRLEAEKAAIDAVISSQAKEATSLVTLLSRLKATNAGTKERKELIDEINKNYGVGLKNLKDEKLFQDQATDAIKSYIEQLKNKVALQLVEDEITKLIEKQIKNQEELQKLQGKVNASTITYTKSLDTQFKVQDSLLLSNKIYLDQFQNQLTANRNVEIASNNRSKTEIDNSNKRIAQIKKENDGIQKQIDDLGTKAQSYTELLEGAFNKLKDSVKGSNKEVEEAKRKQEEIFNSVKRFADEANSAEVELQRNRVRRTVSRIDDLEFERDVTLSKIIQEYEALKKSIELNIKDERNRKLALENLELSYQRKVLIANTDTKEKLDEINLKRLADTKKLLEDLALAERILQTEITFGNGNVADSLLALDQRRRQIELDVRKRQLDDRDFELGTFKELRTQILELEQEFNENQRLLERDLADKERDFQLSEIVKYYDSLEKFNIRFNEETGQYEVTANAKYLEELAKTDRDYLQTSQKEAIAVENVINKTSENLNEEANVKKAEADNKYNQVKIDNSKKSDEEILRNTEKVIEQIAQLFRNVSTTILNVFRAVSEGQQIELENQLNALRRANDQQVDSTNKTYNSEIELLREKFSNGLISQEQYNIASQNLESNRSQFVDGLNQALNDKIFEEQKKAFEKQKKLRIAESIINGISGALTAFTSAFQLGPIAGPIVGGILSALVASTTAIQVANIKKTQFDGNPTTITSPISSGLASGTTGAGSSLSSLGAGFTSFNENLTGTPGDGQSNTNTDTTGPLRVYVVESDITDTQNKVRILENNASFG
jgi:hypothetical protein